MPMRVVDETREEVKPRETGDLQVAGEQVISEYSFIKMAVST